MSLRKKDLIWRLRDLDDEDEVYIDEDDGALRGPQGKLIADDAEMAASLLWLSETFAKMIVGSDDLGESTKRGWLTTVATQAKAQGAEQRWVTKDGYTQLPEQMREELGVGNGTHIWFVKNQGRWQAWPEPELESLLSTEGSKGAGDETADQGGEAGG